MADYMLDQAEGLRRLLAVPRQRVLVVVSAVSAAQKSITLSNMAASLAGMGNDVLLLDACCETQTETIAGQEKVRILTNGTQPLGSSSAGAGAMEWQDSLPGVRLAQLFAGRARQEEAESRYQRLLLAADVVLVDTHPDADHSFPVPAMAQGEVLVLVSPGAESIKAAYALIKRLSVRYGRRRFGVLITNASQHQAQRVHANMAATAQQYLGLELVWVGTVPADEHLARATHLGRSVIEAFPRAGAAVAFRDLAARLTAVGPACAASAAS